MKYCKIGLISFLNDEKFPKKIQKIFTIFQNMPSSFKNILTKELLLILKDLFFLNKGIFIFKYFFILPISKIKRVGFH